jgi:hypothetical protein
MPPPPVTVPDSHPHGQAVIATTVGYPPTVIGAEADRSLGTGTLADGCVNTANAAGWFPFRGGRQ